MDTRSKALLALGLVLLSVPIWAPFLDLTGRDYVYERANVTIAGEEIVAERSSSLWTIDEQIACFGYVSKADDRICRLERALTEGNITAPSGITQMRGQSAVRSSRYIVFGSYGRPYERSVSFNDTTDSYTLGLKPVDPETMLQEVSYDTRYLPEPVEQALKTGEGRSEEPLDHATLYAHDGGYAVVYQAGSRQFLSAKPMVERGFEAILVAIGAVYVYQVGRREGPLDRER